MKAVKQQNRHRPDDGVYGDCHRAAIASVLELDINDVPHFAHDGPPGDEFDRRVHEFLITRGLVPLHFNFASDLSDVLTYMKALNPGVYYLLGGRSKTGVNHTVVCYEDAIVHDPSQNDAGVVGPLDDGFYCITCFGVSNADKLQ